jgi:hypothetical protein
MGLHVRHCALTSGDVTIVRALSATAIERTFRDLKRRLQPVEFLVLAINAGFRLPRFTAADVNQRAEMVVGQVVRALNNLG